MLVTISFAAANISDTKESEKESPLYRVRSNRYIQNKFGNIIENIKSKFLGERAFFLPFKIFRIDEGQPIMHRLFMKGMNTFTGSTCCFGGCLSMN